jgi:signal peptidase I
MINKTFYKIFIALYLIYIGGIIIFSNNFGVINSYTNISYSMAPLINLGSVVIVRSQESYQIGDVISYYAQINNELVIVTHRITEVSGNVYVTKGDANSLEDRELVRPRLIIGKVINIIPELGYVFHFAKSPLGKSLTIIAPAMVIIGIELKNLYRNLRINRRD